MMYVKGMQKANVLNINFNVHVSVITERKTSKMCNIMKGDTAQDAVNCPVSDEL